MAQWLYDNAGNIIVTVILIIVVGLALRSAQKRKKRGGCSCGCENCEKRCSQYNDSTKRS